MATKIGKKVQTKINVVRETARAMMENSHLWPGEFYGKMYWTGYVRAIEQMERILAGQE